MFQQSRPSSERAAKVRAIEAWAREALSLADEAVVMATELRCAEPGCPHLETVIAVIREGGESRQFKIHNALEEVERDDVAQGALRMLRGEAHHHDDAPEPDR